MLARCRAQRLQSPQAGGRSGRASVRWPAGNKTGKQAHETRQFLPHEVAQVCTARGGSLVRGVLRCWEQEHHILAVVCVVTVSARPDRQLREIPAWWSETVLQDEVPHL